MGKRSNFERHPRDLYDTPATALPALLPHLEPATRFAEPCAGRGVLIDHLTSHGHVCVWASDIEPLRGDIAQASVFDLIPHPYVDAYITNPPWDRGLLHPLIVHLSDQAPTWLLFDADWIHTRRAAPYLPRLRKIVSVGRLKWIPDSPYTGKDNCAWHLFTRPGDTPPLFYGR